MGPTNLRIFTCDWDSVHTQRSCSKDKPWWGCRNLVVSLKYFHIIDCMLYCIIRYLRFCLCFSCHNFLCVLSPGPQSAVGLITSAS